MQAGQNTYVPRAFYVRAEERAQPMLEDQRKPCPSCLLRTQKWPELETLKQLLSLCLGLFTASAPFHKQPSLAAICHSYRWLDRNKERESAAHCVFLRRLMSALDQKSREAALALEWGEGPLDKPLRTGCPLMISKIFALLVWCDSVFISEEQTLCCLEMCRRKFLFLYIYFWSL